MTKDSVLTAPDPAGRRRDERRRFLKLAGAGTAAAGVALLAACGGDDDDDTTGVSPTPTPTPTATSVATDITLLQLALNVGYLQAQFWSIAALGRRLPAASVTGAVGTAGDVTGGRQVAFADDVLAACAREIAGDAIAHVNVLRSIVTGASATLVIAQPAIDIAGGSGGAFTQQVLVDAGAGIADPYGSENDLLLAAFLLGDVAVTAYKGLLPLLTNGTYLDAIAGILAAQSYHAATIRTEIYRRGAGLRAQADAISNLRDTLDGTGDRDQGVTGTDTVSNIVPADGNGIVYSRSPAQLHNILYLRTTAETGGGVFPAGTNNSNDALRRSGGSAT